MAPPPETADREPRTRSTKGKKKIRDHRDLRVWRKAGRLAEQCRSAVESFPPAHAELAGVICRLAEEVPHEIATGQSQIIHAAYLDHLGRARAALRHLERRMIDAHKKGCLSSEAGDLLLAQLADIDRMLKKLIVSLELAHASRAGCVSR